MGRGRAKAKQTKVARELKYGGPQTDFDRLQAELGGGSNTYTSTSIDTAAVEDAHDPDAKYLNDDEK